jgi:hypothetical protein
MDEEVELEIDQRFDADDFLDAKELHQLHQSLFWSTL